MRLRVFFKSGNNNVFEEDLTLFVDGIKEFFDINDNTEGVEKYSIINFNNIEYIIPEPDVDSGITSSPSPDDLRDQKHKQEEAIKSDPKKVLERAVKKYDEDQ